MPVMIKKKEHVKKLIKQPSYTHRASRAFDLMHVSDVKQVAKTIRRAGEDPLKNMLAPDSYAILDTVKKIAGRRGAFTTKKGGRIGYTR